jgi:uncharacterized glyoxalase superfamily protein PhnB
MSEPKRPSLTGGVYYRDAKAGIAWLERAFGFETCMLVTNEDGSVGHSEMRFGDSMIFVGGEWDAMHKSPASVGGVNTQALHLQVESGIDDLFARAKAAGAVVLREPADQFYGERSCMVADPDGHTWSIGQTLKAMTMNEMEKAMPGGGSIRERL